MYISGLRNSKSEYRCGGYSRFSGEEVMNLRFNFFEGSNEEILDRQKKGKPYVEMWGNTV